MAILDKMNITYSVYQGTTHSNTPYKQPKEGDPTQIQYEPKPKEILITTKFIEHPYSPYKSYEFTNNPQTYPLPDDKFTSNMTKPHYRVRPISIFGDIWDYTPKYPDFYVKYSTKFSYEYRQKQATYKESKPMPWSNNGRYDYGLDYRNKITRLLMNSIKYKSWDELGLTDYINNLRDKLKQYNWGSDVEDAGLLFLPKQLVDKYLIPTETKAISAIKWVTPKIQKNKQKTKYDASGIDTPNDPTM
jgi:hypothetical protein